MSCGGKCNGSCGSSCRCKKGLGDSVDDAQAAAAGQQERHKKEDWLATYYFGLLFMLAVLAFALHPIVSS
jgi:hypothetical protein